MIKKTYERFGEIVYILKLKNGMQVHMLPKEEPYYTTYVECSIPYGALHTDFMVEGKQHSTPYGSAHFMEHKIFAMPDGDAFGTFSKLGADANAMTSYNQTSYLFTATDHVIEALDHLFYMLDTPYFTDENIRLEQAIIAEELKMYLDDPHVEMQNELMMQLYHRHPINVDIGGTLSSIEAIDKQTLDDIYQTFYQPSQRLIVIAGKIDLKALLAYFKAYETHHPHRMRKPLIRLPYEPKHVVKKHHKQQRDNGMDKLMIGIKLTPKRLNPELQIRREIAMTMMLNMLLGASSKNYHELLKDNLINQSFYVSPVFEKQAEAIIIYAESKKLYTLKRKLESLLTDSGPDTFSETAFERYKKVYLGQFIYALNNLETKAYLYGKYHHMGSSLFEVVDLLTTMPYEDIVESFHEITKKTLTTLIYKKA